VNRLATKKATTPYSFVSSVTDDSLPENGIIINQWLADDLNAAPGDTLTCTWFSIGLLRELTTDSALFIVQRITAMDSPLSDPQRMPFIPGLSDTGSCTAWDAGIPINLKTIRDKDETYWNQYQGTPKAFIPLKTAHKLWANRFGNYTAFRTVYNPDTIAWHSGNSKLSNLGIIVKEVRDQGRNAAIGGVDFGQLFLGLSFFIIVSSLFLNALLFVFHLKKTNRNGNPKSTWVYSAKNRYANNSYQQKITPSGQPAEAHYNRFNKWIIQGYALPRCCFFRNRCFADGSSVFFQHRT